MFYVCMVHRFAFPKEEEDWPRSRTLLVIFTNAVNYEFRAFFHQSQSSLLVVQQLTVAVKTTKEDVIT